MRTKKHEILVAPGLYTNKISIFLLFFFFFLILEKEYTMIVLQATDAQ